MVKIRQNHEEYAVRMELANGEEFNLTERLRKFLHFQDMSAWKEDPKAFDTWMKDTVKEVMSHIDFVII